MAEKREMHTENIKKVTEILSGGKLTALSAAFGGYADSLRNLKDILNGKLAEFKEAEKAAEAAKAEEKAREAMRLASHKLPVKCKFMVKEISEEGGEA